ncbi:transcriptional regulator, TetR family [Sanguibacter gelidistatuariae]|uniref:Transcriptional regulator, TetR family n=1 Tax=Sanguibacter gelidistatuariae TaxID=1814289 RepID=A0A1G6MPU0_9MICO|nr:TetR/AcrR family transcriptional regulator [Sanguibacter gelidistatuariae]SDC57550.1 transcriptional regulator, TetR family [Sanguibacter gelidistatuariae]
MSADSADDVDRANDADQADRVDDAATCATPARRPGRRRDASRDDVILDATRELLVERGFDSMTMDAVAERAGAGKATVYRRWPSKVDLTVDAIVCSRAPGITVDDIPDTGSLRGDLLGVRQAKLRTDTHWILSGLPAEIREDPQVAAALHHQFVVPHTRLITELLERARLRGEVPPGRDIEMIATVGPAMISYQKMTTGRPIEPEFFEQLIDKILVPLATGTTPDDDADTAAADEDEARSCADADVSAALLGATSA